MLSNFKIQNMSFLGGKMCWVEDVEGSGDLEDRLDVLSYWGLKGGVALTRIKNSSFFVEAAARQIEVLHSPIPVLDEAALVRLQQAALFLQARVLGGNHVGVFGDNKGGRVGLCLSLILVFCDYTPPQAVKVCRDVFGPDFLLPRHEPVLFAVHKQLKT